jgi:glycosyltransferase involved in cell wall biosynthesis
MLLSIAMIVKNEEKNIERCLKALEVLGGKINYEIVIVDTGSEDNTIDIVKKYTQRVYEHKWNNNFAEMRNISIKYCKGDWILILDADEVLEEAKDIIEFFKGGIYKKYNCATVKLKNILSADEDNYLIGSLVRIFKNGKDFFYEGRVHEQPKIFAPVAITNISFLHYGYSRADYEVMEYKYKRNIELLLKDLKEGKDLIYTYFQLAQTYEMANKVKQGLDAIKTAFNLVVQNKDKKGYLYVYHFYGRTLFAKNNYEKAIEICEEAIKYSNEHLDFYYILSRSYASLNKYEEANKYFQEYFELHKKLDNGYVMKDISVTNFSFCRKNEVLKEKVLCLYKEKKYEEVKIIFKELEKASDKEELREIYIYSLIKSRDYKETLLYYDNREIMDKDVESIIGIIERIGIEDNNDSVKEVAKNLLGFDDRADLYIKSMYLNEKADFNKKIINFDGFYIWKGEILKKYFDYDEQFIEDLKDLKKQDIKLYINYIVDNYKVLEMLYKYCKKNFMNFNMDTLMLNTCIEEILILNKSIDDEKYSELIEMTYINKINYIEKIYNNEILKSEYSSKILDKYENMWIQINKCIKLYEKDELEYIRTLRKVLNESPEYSRVINLYIKKIDDQNISEEMKQEKKNLLNVAEKFINENKLQDALEILLQLNDIFKYNSEILNFLGITFYVLGRYNEAIINFAISNTIDENNFDTIYNLACVLEANSQSDSAKHYYRKAYDLCKDEKLKEEIINIIK